MDQIHWLTILGIIVVLATVSPVHSAKKELPSFLKSQTYDEPLEFVGIRVHDAHETGATITWETNHPARGRIRFGDTKQMENTKVNTTSDSRHRVQLRGLKEGTKYGFRVYSWDSSNRRIKSQLVFFETKGMPKPRIQRINIKNRTRLGGTVRWVTNVPTTATFSVGHDTPLQHTTVHDSPTRIHEVKLSQFFPNRSVYYRITMTDTRGRSERTTLRSFQTRENNVALNKPIRGTFSRPLNKVSRSELENPVIDRIVDGSLAFPKGLATSGNIPDTDQWFTVDLRQFYVPDTVVIFWRNIARPGSYRIQASKLGQEWSTLATMSAGDTSLIKRSGMGLARHSIPLASGNEDYRYIRVLIPKDSPYHVKYNGDQFVQVFEFKLFPRYKPRSLSDS